MAHLIQVNTPNLTFQGNEAQTLDLITELLFLDKTAGGLSSALDKFLISLSDAYEYFKFNRSDQGEETAVRHLINTEINESGLEVETAEERLCDDL